MKYRFVKRRQEVSTEEINSLRDFDLVLKGSRRLLDIAYKSKLLWTLTIPVAVVVYTLAVNQPAVEEPVQEEQPIQEEVLDKSSEQKEEIIQEEQPKVEEPKTVVSTPPKKESDRSQVPDPLESKFQQPAEEIETSSELLKEDILIKAAPKMGFEKFYQFIDRELTYPELARKDSIQGHVKVLFSVDRAGKVSNITIAESLGDLFDNEAIRVMNRLPDWNPATFNGEPVSSRMSIKLTFKIK